jgi:hypothetical protein
MGGQNNSRLFEEKLINFSLVIALSVRGLRYMKLQLLLIEKARQVVKCHLLSAIRNADLMSFIAPHSRKLVWI